jgi:hypothetical protein
MIRARDQGPNPFGGLGTLEIGLADRRRVAGCREQRLVLRQGSDRKPMDVGIAIQQPPGLA